MSFLKAPARFVAKQLLLPLIWLFSLPLQAGPVMTMEIKGEFSQNYLKIYEALEQHRFFVVFEPNIGQSVSRFKDRWKEDYNRNQLEEIQSLVFCNPWYVNQVSNKDPQMLALCPLSVTLTQKSGITQIYFLRPSQINPQSPAQPILEELEADIVKALKTAVTTD
ncbi:DUF302 domain-containing protein [Marinobacterium jannaschii]|uniref:DUF302 domain-containing protein n=1 Tax=Marinobacterium jannaschii TaxID=64970 RepID=UPI000482B4C7|nr:DUF302 domain-containing protein [Marinobacterium jannaschii]